MLCKISTKFPLDFLYYNVKPQTNTKAKMKYFYTLIISAILLAVSVLNSNVHAQNADKDEQAILVQLTPEYYQQLRQAKTADINKILSILNLEKSVPAGIENLRPVFPLDTKFYNRYNRYGLNRWFVLQFTEKIDVYAAIENLNKNRAIELAEPDYLVESHFLDPNIIPAFNMAPRTGEFDPLFINQWHYENLGQNNGTSGADISLIPAWEVEVGQPHVIVQVTDSGLDTEHPDLINMMWVNPNPGSSGYPNDINGWNFVTDSNLLFDDSGHGTHVSGTIAAENANGVGVAGVAGGSGLGDGARIMTTRIFTDPLVNPGGASTSATAAAITYGADNGSVISNNSWGYTSPGVFPTLIKNAIDYFVDNAGFDENDNYIGPARGGIFISSAGNTPSGARFYPAAYERVISVASTNHNDKKAWYSNFGDHVDISAPGGETNNNSGVGVVGGVYSTNLFDGGENSYAYFQGTSMASPHVAGVAALIVSKFPDLTNDEITARLLNTADDISEANPGMGHLLGTGRLNAFRALTEEIAPGRVTIIGPVNAVDTEATLTFSWNQAAFAETYQLQIATSDEFVDDRIEVDITEITDTVVDATVTLGATDYYWRVRASNEVGDGDWSETGTFVTSTGVSTPDDNNLPVAVSLKQNYPNPFNPATTILFTMQDAGMAELLIYNTLGQRVATLINENLPAGTHRAEFDATNLSSGIYLYQLRTNGIVLTRKMTLVK